MYFCPLIQQAYNSFNHQSAPMKKIFSLFILFSIAAIVHVQAQQQEWAVGLRFGDPSGVNVKKYFGNGAAFDLTLGSSGNFYGGRSRGYRDGYRGAGIALMGNYVWQKEVGWFRKHNPRQIRVCNFR